MAELVATPLLPLLEDIECDVAHWREVGDRASRDRQPAAAILAAARAVGGGDPVERLHAAIREHAPQLAEPARQHATRTAKDVIEKTKRLGAGADQVAAACLGGLLEGAEPSVVLQALAQTLDQLHANRVALDVIRAAIAIAPPEQGSYEDTHALVLINLARFEEAAAATERFSAIDAAKAAGLRSYVIALRQPFDYWLAPMFTAATEDGTGTMRPLAIVRGAIRAIAGRIAMARAAVVELVGNTPWLPDVSALEPVPPDEDDAIAFDIEEQRGSVPDLILVIRREWARLCWVLLGAGSRSLSLPTALAQAPQTHAYYDTIIAARFNLLVDRAGNSALEIQDKLDEQLATTKWGGLDGTVLTDLAPHLAEIWLEEHRCSLAAIRWHQGRINSVFENP